MGFTIEDMMLVSQNHYRMKMEAGQGGWSNSISWLLMVEDTTILKNFTGKELAVTTGLGFSKYPGDDKKRGRADEEKLLELVQELTRRHASGLIINTGYYIVDIPGSVLTWCNDNDLPLLIVPWDVFLADMMKDLSIRVFLQGSTDEQISSALIAAMEDPENQSAYRKELLPYFDLDGTFQVALVDVEVPVDMSSIAIPGPTKSDTSGDAIGNASGNAIGNASGNAMGNAPGDAMGNVMGNASGNAMGNASGNAMGNASGNAMGNASGNDVTNAWEHGNALYDHITLDRMDTVERKRIGYRLQLALTNLTHNGHFFYYDSYFVVVMNAVKEKTAEKLMSDFKKRAAKRLPDLPITIAMGSQVTDIARLRNSYLRARAAMRRAQSIARMDEGTFGGNGTHAYGRDGAIITQGHTDYPGVTTFDRMGIARMLYMVSDQALLDEMGPQLLAPLLEYDKTHKSDLTRTLELYLRYDQSIQAVAADMYIHRNTILYRIKKIKQLLGCELATQEERLPYEIACMILHM